MLLSDFMDDRDKLVDLRIGAGISGGADDRWDSKLARGKQNVFDVVILPLVGTG